MGKALDFESEGKGSRLSEVSGLHLWYETSLRLIVCPVDRNHTSSAASWSYQKANLSKHLAPEREGNRHQHFPVPLSPLVQRALLLYKQTVRPLHGSSEGWFPGQPPAGAVSWLCSAKHPICRPQAANWGVSISDPPISAAPVSRASIHCTLPFPQLGLVQSKRVLCRIRGKQMHQAWHFELH